MDTFERIALDAASLSISHTATSASASTVGLGYVSGRVIMALGDFALRGVGRVNIEIRLRRIASRIRTERPELWSRAMIEELIERQRILLYPQHVRLKSWVAILEVLEKGGWPQLAAALNMWPSIEVQLFYRHLALWKLCGWTVRPPQGALLTAETWHAIQGRSLTDRSHMLSRNMARMFSASLEQEPAVLHELFTLDAFAVLQADVGRSARANSETSLDTFFRSLALWNPFRDLPSWTPTHKMLDLLARILTSYPTVDCLVNFLCTGDSNNIKLVIDHILDAVDRWISSDGSREPVDNTQSLHYSSNTIHPIWPFLCFAVFLAYKHAGAARLLLASRLCQHLRNLIKSSFPISLNRCEPPVGRTKQLIIVACHLLLSAIKHHHALDDSTSNFQLELESYLDDVLSDSLLPRGYALGFGGPMTWGEADFPAESIPNDRMKDARRTTTMEQARAALAREAVAALTSNDPGHAATITAKSLMQEASRMKRLNQERMYREQARAVLARQRQYTAAKQSGQFDYIA